MSTQGYANYIINNIKNNRPDEYKKLNSFFEKLLFVLKSHINEIEIDIWIKDIFPLSTDNGIVLFAIQNKLQQDIIISKYHNYIISASNQILNTQTSIYYMNEVGIILDVENNKEISYDDFLSQKNNSVVSEKLYTNTCNNFTSEYTFETFVVGNSNRFAHAASLAVAESPSFNTSSTNESGTYNPLFIYGGSGLGKTHLLYAIMNRVKEKFPSAKILYIKGDEFTNELILSIQNHEQMNFRNKYRYVDLLLVDDIQFIAGKIATQEEFFHTFNSLHEANKQIILTSDRPPKEISTLEERLSTRFVWGLTADIQPPDFETRVAIIKRKALSLNVSFDTDVVNFIANNVKTNIRQIEGAVKKLRAYKMLTNTEIDINSSQNALKDILLEIEGSPITPDLIIEEVSKYYSVSISDIKSKKRTNEISAPRHVAMYICRELTDLSLPAIGDEFGGRDHTTVIHAIKKVEDDIKNSVKQKQMINDIIKNIKEK